MSAHRRRPRALWWVLALVVPTLIAGAWVVWFSPWLSVENVQIVVNGEAPDSAGAFPVTDVEAVIDLPEGTPLVRVPAEAIVARVSALPQVRSAQVVRQWPRTLVIDIERRTPVAAAVGADGFDLVDLEGMVVTVVPDQPADLPLVAATGAGLPAALAVAAQLPVELRDATEVIEATTRNDVTLILRKSGTLPNGGEVVWGDADQGALKAEVLQALVSPEWDRYNVSAPTAPTTARSDNSTPTVADTGIADTGITETDSNVTAVG
jgi:cell division protein FtsQ